MLCGQDDSVPSHNEDFFEGAEKTLHIWFTDNQDEAATVNNNNNVNGNVLHADCDLMEYMKTNGEKRKSNLSNVVCIHVFMYS